MNRKRLISFLFGSTALATSMSFLPLADAHAHVQTEHVDVLQEFEGYSTKSSLHGLDSIVDIQDLKTSLVVDSKTPEIDPNLLMSRVAGGFGQLVDYSSDEETVDIEGEGYELISGGGYLPRSDSDLDLRRNIDEKVGVFTTTDLRDAARHAQAVYDYANPEANNDIKKFKEEGSTVSFVKTLKKEVSWYETTFENQDTAMFVTQKDGTAVLSFKGSDRLQTWLSDFNALMTDHEDGGRYHTGFLNMYKEMETSLWDHVRSFAKVNNYSIEDALNNLTVAGHSRGSGAAQVFSDIARRKYGVAVKTILFAAPRALHKHTAAEYNEAAKDVTLNFAQAKDPVYYAALSTFNGGAHVGNKVFTALDRDLYPHVMDGYRNMANMMHGFEAVVENPDKDNQTQYRFEAHEEAPRDLASEKDHSVQAYAESAISGVKAAANTVVSGVKTVASTVASGVKSVASTIASPFKKARGWFSS